MTRTLFYPCCGSADLARAVDGFGHLVDSVHGADPYARLRRQFEHAWEIQHRSSRPYHYEIELEPNGPEGIRNWRARMHPMPPSVRLEYLLRSKSDGRTLEFVWHRYDAIEALRQVPPLTVFFARWDSPTDGEGGSGILWFGDRLLPRVLAKLVPGGLLVTDGYGTPEDGPQSFLRRDAIEAVPSEGRYSAFGRVFECVGVFDDARAKTLVWRVD